MLEFLGAIFLFIIIIASSFVTTLFIVGILKEEKKIDLLHLFKIGYCITNTEMDIINRIDKRGQERGEIIENVRDFFKNNFINLSEEEMTDLYNISNNEKSSLKFKKISATDFEIEKRHQEVLYKLTVENSQNAELAAKMIEEHIEPLKQLAIDAEGFPSFTFSVKKSVIENGAPVKLFGPLEMTISKNLTCSDPVFITIERAGSERQSVKIAHLSKKELELIPELATDLFKQILTFTKHSPKLPEKEDN